MDLYDFLFGQYATYATLDIYLEGIAVIFGFVSVWYSKKNNILVFPTGMVNTGIFVYLLYKWGLLGDMIINSYFFIMSIYGWYVWTSRDADEELTPISRTTAKDILICIGIFLGAVALVFLVYTYFEKWTSWTAYVDTLTTGIFFVGMWLMARRKIENWILWIVGNIISVPLYFYKGYTLTSIQYTVLIIIAISGYLEWKKHLDSKKAI